MMSSWILVLFLTLQAIYVIHATPRTRGRAPHNTAAFGEIISQNQENDKGEISSDTAAFHRHSKPNLTLFGFTQHLLKAIKEGKDKFTGLLESGRHDHDLAMEFAFDLSNKLVSLDDIGVSHFNSGSEFIAKSGHKGLQVGNVLLGSLVGHWARAPGSVAGVHSASADHFPDLPQGMMKGDASQGGLAHLSVIRSVTPLSDGTFKVATSKKMKERVFRAGRVALGWNHTEVKTRRRRTDEEIDTLLGGSDPERRKLYNPGVCDEYCPEGVKGEHLDDEVYDRIGGCTYDDWWGDCDGVYYIDDDDSEFCYYCFEYAKEVKAFGFNYNEDSSAPGAQTSQIALADNVFCTNCWAYLGASAFVVVEWKGTALKTAQIGVTGGAGFGFDLQMTGLGEGTTQTLSGTKTLFNVPECVPPIRISSILTITPTCILESTVTSTLEWLRISDSETKIAKRIGVPRICSSNSKICTPDFGI